MSTSKQEKSHITVLKKVIGASLGGFCEATLLHPLDTIKSRLQMYKGRITMSKVTVGIYKHEGLLAFYKGYTPFVTHLMSKYALRFYINFTLRSKLINKKDSKNNRLSVLFSGLMAGIVEGILIVTPFEVVKISLQKQYGLNKTDHKYNGIIRTGITIAKNEGILRLWKGLTPTLIRNGSNQMCNFFVYDTIKNYLYPGKGRKNERDSSGMKKETMKLHESIVVGCISGSVGPVLNCPCDVIKTRMMASESNVLGFVGWFVEIAKNEGVHVFYRGLTPRLMRVAGGQGIMWTVVEQTQKMFNKYEI